ncbi:hypothetical protein BABINDRAFT_169908 [Babjeviella inositovora NRRL Y-12698]|uniref:SUR7-domain-containing protein n=1 Tax=Babjeviella inositovora NRRL Y-12698 TaxID=984486 RepID=A0A1E3R043_9ASCO|nr:uncharacterized protein BABINDRAFT_169908 [Babjeviella inositovora NRRL Y-12698]ODQ82712.1 hypothetical protein BABINDRAFT_169908 [Babjeviella inositovora NRRL Y-12698]
MKLAIGGLNTFFLLGANLLIALIVLSGVVTHAPFDKFYWLQADTSTIDGAPELSRWTFWGLCQPEARDGASINCNTTPDYPLSPLDNFPTSANIPSDFVKNRDTYYYLTRTAFPLYFVGWAFAFVSVFTSIFSWCSHRLNFATSIFTFLGLLTTLTATVLQTAAIAMAKKTFKNAGNYSHIGPTMLGLTWAASVCIAIVFFSSTGAACYRGFKEHAESVHEANHEEEYKSSDLDKYTAPTDTQLRREVSSEASATQAFEDPYAAQNNLNQEQPQQDGEGSGIRFFKVRKVGQTPV